MKFKIGQKVKVIDADTTISIIKKSVGTIGIVIDINIKASPYLYGVYLLHVNDNYYFKESELQSIQSDPSDADIDDVLDSFGITNTTVACYILGLLAIGGIIGVIIMHLL